jgi:hypothetical protein
MRTYAGLLLLISVDDMYYRQSHQWVQLELARPMRKADSSEDLHIAHIGHCAKAGLEWSGREHGV